MILVGNLCTILGFYSFDGTVLLLRFNFLMFAFWLSNIFVCCLCYAKLFRLFSIPGSFELC